MTDKEKEKALEAYIDAMTPRDQYGRKEGLATRDGVDREILYPYRKLDERGCIRPMTFFEEFLDRKIPDDLAYAPGYQKAPVPVDDPHYSFGIYNAKCG